MMMEDEESGGGGEMGQEGSEEIMEVVGVPDEEGEEVEYHQYHRPRIIGVEGPTTTETPEEVEMMELGGEEVYEEEIGIEGEDKENAESDTDFLPGEDESSSSIMEITRRRVSQDREGNCYCGKDRNLNIAELLCASCNRWYHESCIGFQLGRLVPFMMNYVFMCKNCSPTGLESFKRSQAQLSQMCVTALANLTQASVKDGSNKRLFSKDRDIIPYLEMHWEALTTTTRRATSSWHGTVLRTLQKDIGVWYMMEEIPEEPASPYFRLASNDLTIIKPNYEVMIKSGQLKVSDNSSAAGPGAGRGRGPGKRRNAMETTPNNNQATLAKKTKDLFTTKVFHGYPPDHPYNKDNFRYWLAEPDPNAPFRQEFDESSDGAGKPIPGFLYRVLIPSSVLLALHDRAPQLKISDDRLSVTGEKGYAMVRATHGVRRGIWYYEAKITELPEGGATRIGFSQPQANLQGPLGYDQFGYSWRSRYGTGFHQAKGKTFAKGGYGLGDVIGIMIVLPENSKVAPLVPDCMKDKPLVRFKSHLYYEEKDVLLDGQKKEDVQLPVHPGSKIMGFRNGECCGVAFENISAGTYFPTISLYRGTVVKVNFGPDPWCKPDTDLDYRMFSEKAEDAIIEQTVADLVYLTENDGKLTLEHYL